MKRFPILTTTAAVLALMTAGSFAAPKKKTVGDTAKGIIDALLGDDKQPAPGRARPVPGSRELSRNFPASGTSRTARVPSP